MLVRPFSGFIAQAWRSTWDSGGRLQSIHNTAPLAPRQAERAQFCRSPFFGLAAATYETWGVLDMFFTMRYRQSRG
jgi:hypothetical protein